MKRLLCCVGTRPEAIKMAPVIRALRGQPGLEARLVSTGQHREILEQTLGALGIEIDVGLDVMRPDQSLAGLTARLLASFDELLEKDRPDLVLAQGDTTSVFAVSLACFYRGVPFAHVEAGLRTHDIATPFPEEANRVLAGRLATLHFAPTDEARSNLLREGVDAEAIHVVGNTCIDALLAMREAAPELELDVPAGAKLALVTSHRRESFGAPMRGVCGAIRQLLDERDDLHVLWPVHPNPNVAAVVRESLGDHARAHLCDPLPYDGFVAAMQRATLILTDSGGVQEEAPALRVPVLVLREESERPEAVDAGVSLLVGTDPERILLESRRLLDDASWYAEMSRGASPYGDGLAAARIHGVIARFLALPGHDGIEPAPAFDAATSRVPD